MTYCIMALSIIALYVCNDSQHNDYQHDIKMTIVYAECHNLSDCAEPKDNQYNDSKFNDTQHDDTKVND